MPIDSFTVLLFGLFVKLLLGALFAAFWLKNRTSSWFAWWGAALLCGSVTSALFMLRVSGENYLTLGFGNAFLMAAFGCVWQGSRTFEKRHPLWLPVLAAPAIWLVACLVPGFMETVEYRIALSSTMVSVLLVLAALETWRGRQEALASRWPVILLLCS